jgi:6-phosphogluconate dehydrogenase
MSQCDIGLIGLAVMGENLVLNMADHGFHVAVFNRTTAKVDEFVNGAAKGKRISGAKSLAEFVSLLKKPRRVMLMVKAGRPVDDFIEQLIGVLEPGDIIIDGGNSHFADTERRTKYVESKGMLYVGTGVSGGEEGARHGPSIMPGGSVAAWPLVRAVFQAIAAKVGPNNDIPCCEWVGAGGSGHYVKMVHNGIEYGDMQLICEAYMLLKQVLGLSASQMRDVFDQWNKGQLDSYLIEITRDIFGVMDRETGQPLVELILDTAGQKGTGKWSSQHALDLGVPTTLIAEAVFARCLSAMKQERVRASAILSGPAKEALAGDRNHFIDQIRDALYASKICSYAQGFAQLRSASNESNWDLNFGNIALMWRGGCIIRAAFLDHIKRAFSRDATLENLLLDPYFRDAVSTAQANWRHVVATAIHFGIPTPAFSAAIAYYDGYRQERLPANLLQAQRDYFGAHTYQRIDKQGVFHTDWVSEAQR